MNQVTLLGRLTKDLILRTSTNSKKFTYFTVAIDGYQQKVNYINCIAWERLAENMASYVGKGSQVLVSGHLATRKDTMTNQTIMEVVTNNVTFLDRKKQAAVINNDEPEIISATTSSDNINNQAASPLISENLPVHNDYDSDISFVSSTNLDHIINKNNDNLPKTSNKTANLNEDEEAIIWD